MSYFPFQFEGVVTHHDVGSDKYAYTVVYVPEELLADLPLKEFPRLRINGEINDYPIEASLTPSQGKWYILLSKKLLKAIEKAVGDSVEVRFHIGDQDAVDIPTALQTALKRNQQLQALWASQTPGKQRGLAYKVASAKTPKTQEKRIDEVFRILKGEIDLRGKPIVKKG